jgi:ABC-2 type transport system permease protein
MNNFKDIFTVAKFTMRDMIGRKSFRISTLIILILIVVGFNVPSFIQNFSNPDNNTILFVDRDNIFSSSLNTLRENSELGYQAEISTDNDETIRQKIDNDEINSAFIIEKTDTEPRIRYIVKNTATISEPPQQIIDQLNSLYSAVQLSKLGLTESELATLIPNFDLEIEQTESEVVGGNIGVMMILSCILFFAIYFCAFQVSSSITVEKTSKIIETLVTSTSPRSIILGKTIGIGLVGLGQMLLFVVTAILSAYSFLDSEILNAMLDLSNFTPYLAIITLVYFILGYFVYALLYAVTGATVSKPEDIQAANTPVVILTMIGFYLAYFTLMNPTGELNIFASLLPISSPFCMPLRVMMGVASSWDVCLSILILLITCIVVAHIAIKIYSNAILNYGNQRGLKNLFKMYKEK